MWKFLAAAIAAALIASAGESAAQNTVLPGYQIPPTTQNPVAGWVAVSKATPLPVTTDSSGALPVPIANSSQLPLSVSGLTTLTVPAAATQALVCVETANVRWSDDGTTPSTTVGQLLVPGQCKAFSSPSLVKFNPATGATASITVSYYQ